MSDKGRNPRDFEYIGSGTNSEGNHYCRRDYGDAGTGFHYANRDGSYFYKNPGGSKYYNNGKGFSQLKLPNGEIRKFNKPSK